MVLKILMITTSYLRWKDDFSGKMIHNLSKHLVKGGHEVVVLCPHFPNSKDFEIIDGVKIYRFRYSKKPEGQYVGHGGLVHKLTASKLFSPTVIHYFAACRDKIIELDKKYDFDILHSHWPIPSGLITEIANKKLKKKTVVHLRFSSLDWQPWVTFLHPFNKFVFKNVDRIIAISPALSKLPIKMGFGKKTRVVLNGIDLDLYKRNRIKYVKNTQIKKILFIGNLAKYKAPFQLLDAFKSLIKEIPNIHLIIQGVGPLDPEIKKRIKKYNLEKLVTLRKPDFPENEMPDVFNEAYMFVLPSLDEGGPNILLEAMAVARPIVTTKVGWAEIVIKNKYNGIIVNPGSVTELKNGMKLLLTNYPLASKFGKNARKYIEKNLSWKRSAEEVEKAYKEIL